MPTSRRFPATIACIRATLWVTLVSLVLTTPLVAGDTVIQIRDAEVAVGASGTHSLIFNIERGRVIGGMRLDGARLAVETAAGGDNPALPGEDYVPLPTGTEVLLPPGEEKTSVEVEVFGGPAGGADATLLLRVNEAQAYHPEPALKSAGRRLGDVCCTITSLVAADLNGNGHMDIVTGNGETGTVSVLLADGEGGYGTATSYPLPELHHMVVEVIVGDATGNGHPDVIAAGFHSRQVAVLAGDGSGTLTSPQVVDLGVDLLWPVGVALVDVTGNGFVDIVTANLLLDGGDETVSIMQGDGQGGFTRVQPPAVGHQANAIAVGDVTGNGHPDIVVSNGGAGAVTLLAGDGGGNFAAPAGLGIGPQARPESIVLADVTGNGYPDIVTANAAESSSPFPDPNLAASVSVLEGEEGGAFAEAVQLNIGPGAVRRVIAGDLGGNDHLDLIVTRNDNKVTVLSGEGQGEFGSPVHLPTGRGSSAAALLDVIGNGHPDIVVGGGHSVSLLPNHGEGALGFGNHYTAGRRPAAVTAADLNGNGYPDVVTANAQAHTISVLLQQGPGEFVDATEYAVENSPMAVSVADIDGNGIPDLLVANAAGGSVSVLIGDGEGGFADAVHYPVSDEWITPFAMAVGDATGNGHLDIVTANTHQAEARDYISLLAGGGDGTFADPVTFPVGEGGVFHYPESVVLADIDGNGHADIVTANAYSGNLSVLTGDGQGNFSHTGYLQVGLRPERVAVADVTGSGHVDLIVLDHAGQRIAVLAGHGDGTFAGPEYFLVFTLPVGLDCNSLVDMWQCPWPGDMVVADVTGDGHLDIVTANTNADSVTVLVNDGRGDFSSFLKFGSGASPSALVAADFTGNGNTDIVTANRMNDNVTLLANELSRVVLPQPEAVGRIIYGPAGDILFEDRFETKP